MYAGWSRFINACISLLFAQEPSEPLEDLGQGPPIDRQSPTESAEIIHAEERAPSPRGPAYVIPDANPNQIVEEVIVAEDLTNVPTRPSPIDVMEVDGTKESPIHVDESGTPADMEEAASFKSPEAHEAAPLREGQRLDRYLRVAL